MLRAINTKILISGITILAAAALAIGGTFAWFSDTETSKNNVLQAGALDLVVDNTCYYNGDACINGFWDGDDSKEECSCTWTEKDLGPNDLFFHLTDLKPGDWEEDTISLHVKNNNAWACADIKVTENSDNGITEPEDEVGGPLDNDGTPLGDLAEELNFIFWLDDGDNVFERDEVDNIITRGPASAVLGDVRWALADSQTVVLEEGPLVGSRTYFIGKAMCYGVLTLDPVPQRTNSPTVDPGIDCDGSNVSNISQTDKLMGDISFYVEQARNNEDFLCNP